MTTASSSHNNDISENGKEKEEQVDWDSILYQQDRKIEESALDKTDFLALFIASVETIFLPLIILAAILIGLSLLFWFF